MNVARFAKWVIEEGPFAGCELDGVAVQEMAVKCGLLIETKYDEKIHGDANCDWIEQGDRYYVFSDKFKDMLGL